MNSPAHNYQIITRYLLGSLPENETERFDELSLTDAAFVDSLIAVENDLLDEYVRGELKRGKLKRFEASYLTSPLRRKKVEFARCLQLFVQVHLSLHPTYLSAEEDAFMLRDGLSGLLSRVSLVRLPLFAQFALAAAVLALFVVGGWFLLDNLHSLHQVAEEQTIGVVRLRTEVAVYTQLDKQCASAAEERIPVNNEPHSDQSASQIAKYDFVVARWVLRRTVRGASARRSHRAVKRTKISHR